MLKNIFGFCRIGFFLLISSGLLGQEVNRSGERFPTIKFQGSGRAADRLKSLGDKAKDLARWYGKTEDELKTMAADSSLQMSDSGELFYTCGMPHSEPGKRFQRKATKTTPSKIGAAKTSSPATPARAPAQGKALAVGGGTMAAALAPLDQTFLLHSRPGSTRKIYLDFNGHTTQDPRWRSGSTFYTPPYDEDDDTATFSDDEKLNIQKCFNAVAEDFMLLDVDVTTEDPGVEALRRSSTTDSAYGIRVCIGGTTWSTGHVGIAYIGSFNSSTDTPCFVFSEESLAIYPPEAAWQLVADIASHEVGHTLGLDHARTTDAWSPEYYEGHADWAPLMGTSFGFSGFRTVTQWSKREYASAPSNNLRDEIATMNNYVALREDDYGDNIYEAYPLGTGMQGQVQGVIHSREDADVFRFYTGAGEVYIQADAAEYAPNLNVKLTVYNGAGEVVATADTPTVFTPELQDTGMSTHLLVNLPAGAYFVFVDGVGSTGDPTTGYNDYGSLGQYTLNAYWQVGLEPANSTAPPANYPPVAVAGASHTSGIVPLTTTFSSTGSSDSDGSIASYEWDFGDGTATSTSASPSHEYTEAGTYNARLTVTDNVGATSSATITVIVTNPVPTGLVTTVTMTQGSPPIDIPSGSYVNATKANVNVRFKFSSPVTHFDLSDVQVTNCTLSNFSGYGANYSARVSSASQGSISISVPAAVAQAESDGASNLASNVLGMIHDSIAPTATWTVPSAPSATSPIPLTLTFSEPPFRAMTTGDFPASTSGTVTAVNPVSSTVFTVYFTPARQEELGTGVIQNIVIDAAGNGNAKQNTPYFSYDPVAPVVTVTGYYRSTTYPDPDHVYFEVGVSEAYTGMLDAGDLEISGATLDTITNLGGSPAVYAVELTPVAEGPVALTVKAATVTDVAGNSNVAATGIASYDLSEPTLLSATVGGHPASGSPLPVVGTDPVAFVFTFSEPAQWATTAYTTSVTNGTVVRSAAEGAVLTLWVQPTSSGTITVSSLSVTDLFQNEFDPTTAALLPAEVTFDATLPPVIIVSASVAYSKTSPLTFEIQVSEPLTDLTAADLVVTNGTVSGSLVQSPTDSNRYTVAVTPTAQGPVSCSVPASCCTDASANANAASNTASVVYDTGRPNTTVLVAGPPLPIGTNISPVVFHCVFDEAVTWLDNSKIEVTGGTLTSMTAVNDSTYELSITPSEIGIVTCRVRDNAAKDPSGNLSLASATTPASVIYDNMGPKAMIYVNNFATSESTFPFSLFFEDDYLGTLSSSEVTVTNASKGTLTLESYGGYTQEVTVSTSYQGPVTCSIAAGAVTDDLGNPSLPATVTVIRDSIPPTVTLGTPSRLYTNSGPVSIPVTVTDTNAITLLNTPIVVTGSGITVSSKFLKGSDDKHWTLLLYNMQGQGAMTVKVAAYTFRDIAYNSNNNPSSAVTINLDKTVPTVTSPGTKPTIAASAASVTFNGTGFTANPAMTVTFNNGDAGAPSSATSTSLTVPFLTQPTAGALYATVTDSAGNESLSKHIANVKPVITATTSATNSLANTSAYLVIRGFGFDPMATNNTVTLTGGGISGAHTPLVANGNTLILTGWAGPLTNGNITATVTSNGFSSGTAVQVATVVAPSALEALNPALVAPSSGTPDVEVVSQLREGKLLVGGIFNISGTGVNARSNLARLTTAGAVDTSTPVFNAGASYYISSVVQQPDGKILVGGDFYSIKPSGTTAYTTIRSLARLNADGTLDTGFNPNPYIIETPSQNVVFVQKVILQPDGKILVCGLFSGFQPNGTGPQIARNSIARLNADGTVDPTFDPNPLAPGVTMVVTMARQEDGQVVFSGTFEQLQPNQTGTPLARHMLARVNSDGSPDLDFQPDPDIWPETLAVQPDGKVVVGGSFTQFAFPSGTVTHSYLARLNVDGNALDSTFDPQPNASVGSLALQTDGRIFVGGSFTSLNPNGAGTLTRNKLARLKTDGTADATWVLPTANNSVYTLTGQKDGKLLVGGAFTSVTPNGGSATARKYLMRVHNDTAAEALILPSMNEVAWYRYGSCPEISDVTFDMSTDGGSTWTLLGTGTRMSGASPHWQCTGLPPLPTSGRLSIRARGNAGAHLSGGSTHVELIQAF